MWSLPKMGVSTWRYAKPPKPKERQPTETGPRYGEWAGRGPKRASRGPPVLAKTTAPGHTSVLSQKLRLKRAIWVWRRSYPNRVFYSEFSARK